MKISCISFTANGSRINKRLEQWFEAQGECCDCQALARYAEAAGVKPLEGSFKDWCRIHFASADVMVFIGATGIAVRGIAPWVKDKKTDPAVIVIDEQANFVISLLSGHIGGANEMALRIADYLGAVPVVTTGTDVNHTFAVDVFASRNQLVIDDMQLAKEIAARVIDKLPVGFASELPVTGQLPGALTWEAVENEAAEKCANSGKKLPEVGIRVTIYNNGNSDCRRILDLIPRNVHLGIGCKRGTPFAAIEERVQQVMESCHVDWRSVVGVASIDLKKDEEGLKAFCEAHELPFTVYSAEELNGVEGSFTPSRFVGSITGVDNVCERSAALDCIRNRWFAKGDNQEGSFKIIQKKAAGGGVTVALAMEDWSVRFE